MAGVLPLVWVLVIPITENMQGFIAVYQSELSCEIARIFIQKKTNVPLECVQVLINP